MANPATPNRGTSEQELDQFNIWFRSTPIYQNFMRQNGLPTDGRVKLSRSQQSRLEQLMKANGINIPGGMHIDQGGNLNQKNRLGRNVAIGAGIAGAAIGIPAALGAFGGGAGAAGAGAAGVLPSTATATGFAPLAGTATSALGGGAALGGGTAAALGGAASLLPSTATATGFAPLAGTAASSPVLGANAALGAGGGVANWLKGNIPSLAMLGLSGIGGAMSDKGTTSEQETTSTSMPTLDPAYKGIQDSLIASVQRRLTNPYSLPVGYEQQGIEDINNTYNLVGQSLNNDLTARGLGASPVAGSGRSTLQRSRAGDIVRFQRQLPMVERQFQDADIGLATGVLGLGRGNTTTSKGKTTADAGGGGVGGAFSNIAQMLAYLQGMGAFRQPGRIGY